MLRVNHSFVATFSTVFVAQRRLKENIKSIIDGLSVVTSGPPTVNVEKAACVFLSRYMQTLYPGVLSVP